MPCDQWHQHIVPPRPQQRHRAGLIALHEPAVADHISGKNSGEAAVNAILGHGDAIAFQNPDGRDCMGALTASLSHPTSAMGPVSVIRAVSYLDRFYTVSRLCRLA